MKEVKEVYDEINLKYNFKQVYVEDFTPEQVFFQIEDLCNLIIKNYESVLDNAIKKSKKLEIKKEEEEKKEDINEDNLEHIGDVNEDDEDSFDKKPKLLQEDSESFSNSNDREISSFSASDEESLDYEEIKNKPASEIFKILDKNLKK